MSRIHFEWSVDCDGYDIDLRKPKPKPVGRRSSLLTGEVPGPFIVRRLGPLMKTTPLGTQLPTQRKSLPCASICDRLAENGSKWESSRRFVLGPWAASASVYRWLYSWARWFTKLVTR